MKALMLMAVGMLMAADSPADDAKRLEGTWLVVGVAIEGKPIPDAQVTKRHETLTFKGEKVTIRNARPEENSTGFKIDPTKSPKTLDLNGPGNNPANGRAFIYEIKGDVLKLCQGKSGKVAPKELVSKPGSETMVLTLERRKP